MDVADVNVKLKQGVAGDLD